MQNPLNLSSQLELVSKWRKIKFFEKNGVIAAVMKVEDFLERNVAISILIGAKKIIKKINDWSEILLPNLLKENAGFQDAFFMCMMESLSGSNKKGHSKNQDAGPVCNVEETAREVWLKNNVFFKKILIEMLRLLWRNIEAK